MIKKTYIAVFIVLLRVAWNFFNIFSELLDENFIIAIISDFAFALIADYFNLYSIQ